MTQDPTHNDSDASALTRDFYPNADPSPTMLIELRSSTTVASQTRRTSPIAQLAEFVGKPLNAVFDRPTASTASRPGTHTDFATSTAPAAAELDRFAEFEIDDWDQAGGLADDLRNRFADLITDVLPVPPAIPAIGPAWAESRREIGQTPDLRYLQGYLFDAPGGVGAFRAWQVAGGAGQGVTVIDVEGGWQFSHENLAPVRFNLWGGENLRTPAWRDHGTAVVGILGGSPDGVGTLGICPGARIGCYSVFENGQASRQRVANAIVHAGDLLTPGDVLLIELQRPGPLTNYHSDADQRGYLPVTYWPDIRAAVRSLVNRGLLVVAVAGNGGQDLDDERLGGRLDPDKHDSGAIHVGAGAPPGGAFGAARLRLDFSNFGRCVDVQGWGQSVTTSGYGDLWASQDPDRAYTGAFMGTSSAAPIVAGVVTCLQGRHKALYGVPMAPLAVRQVLRSYGWRPEIDDETVIAEQQIGLQPDLSALFTLLGLA
jgi:hypothetical protein